MRKEWREGWLRLSGASPLRGDRHVWKMKEGGKLEQFLQIKSYAPSARSVRASTTRITDVGKLYVAIFSHVAIFSPLSVRRPTDVNESVAKSIHWLAWRFLIEAFWLMTVACIIVFLPRV